MIKITRNIILKFVNRQQSKIPNPETQKVIREARKGQNLVEMNNIQELKKFIK